jgi:hypothetical protein
MITKVCLIQSIGPGEWVFYYHRCACRSKGCVRRVGRKKAQIAPQYVPTLQTTTTPACHTSLCARMGRARGESTHSPQVLPKKIFCAKSLFNNCCRAGGFVRHWAEPFSAQFCLHQALFPLWRIGYMYSTQHLSFVLLAACYQSIESTFHFRLIRTICLALYKCYKNGAVFRELSSTLLYT